MFRCVLVWFVRLSVVERNKVQEQFILWIVEKVLEDFQNGNDAFRTNMYELPVNA